MKKAIGYLLLLPAIILFVISLGNSGYSFLQEVRDSNNDPFLSPMNSDIFSLHESTCSFHFLFFSFSLAGSLVIFDSAFRFILKRSYLSWLFKRELVVIIFYFTCLSLCIWGFSFSSISDPEGSSSKDVLLFFFLFLIITLTYYFLKDRIVYLLNYSYSIIIPLFVTLASIFGMLFYGSTSKYFSDPNDACINLTLEDAAVIHANYEFIFTQRTTGDIIVGRLNQTLFDCVDEIRKDANPIILSQYSEVEFPMVLPILIVCFFIILVVLQLVLAIDKAHILACSNIIVFGIINFLACTLITINGGSELIHIYSNLPMMWAIYSIIYFLFIGILLFRIRRKGNEPTTIKNAWISFYFFFNFLSLAGMYFVSNKSNGNPTIFILSLYLIIASIIHFNTMSLVSKINPIKN